MLLISCALNLKLTDFLCLYLPLTRYFSCGCWAAYFYEYNLRTLHSYLECIGPCNKHVFPPVGTLLRWPAYSSCACQGSPSWVWSARWIPLSYVSWCVHHGWYLPSRLFQKVLPLCRLDQQSPFTQKFHRFPYWSLFQNPGLLDMPSWTSH